MLNGPAVRVGKEDAVVALHNNETTFQRPQALVVSNWRLMLALGVTATFWIAALAGAVRMLAQ